MLVVTHAGGAKGKALADGLRAAGATSCPPRSSPSTRERVAFVRDEIRRHGGKCTRGRRRGAPRGGRQRPARAGRRCSQLVADTDGRIDGDTVARYYRGRAEVSGFTVADAAMVGDVAGALEALRWALHVGVDPVPIADALPTASAPSPGWPAGRGNAYQLASSLGMPPWKVERAQRQARGWTPEGLASAMRAVAHSERRGQGRRGRPGVRAGAGGPAIAASVQAAGRDRA